LLEKYLKGRGTKRNPLIDFLHWGGRGYARLKKKVSITLRVQRSLAKLAALKKKERGRKKKQERKTEKKKTSSATRSMRRGTGRTKNFQGTKKDSGKNLEKETYGKRSCGQGKGRRGDRGVEGPGLVHLHIKVV